MKASKLFPAINYWILGVLIVVLMTQLSWKTADGKYNQQIISGDGIGYYQYLVNYFYKDNFENQEQDSDFMMEYEGRVVNKCFAGAALCMAPFYKIAELHAWLVGEAFDPFTPRTKKWINIGALFYLFVGLAFIMLWLRLLKFKERPIFWSICGISLGSNLFLYAILSPGMTHVYSFFAVAGFLFLMANFFLHKNKSSLILASLFLGLIVVIRPINGLVIILLPLLSNGLKNLLDTFKSLPLKVWLVAKISGLIPILIQLYLWFLQTGEWIVWSYGEEGFYWLNPQIFEVLFGFRKGWFVYTPIAVISLFGLSLVYKKSKEQFYSLLLFFVAIIYVVSSWWNWFYGSSFGQRSFVDFYAVNAFLLAGLLEVVFQRRFLSIISKVFIFGLICLNLFQSFQYKENIISSWDMSSKKYLATFGVSEPNQVRIGGSREILPYNAQKELLLDTALNVSLQNNQANRADYFDYSNKEYGVSLKYDLKACSDLSRGYFVELELSRLELELNSSENAKLIAEMKDVKGNVTYYHWFLINEVPAKEKGEWQNYTYQLKLPKCASDNSTLLLYIRNEDKADFLISKFDVRVFDLY